ncbi:MAG TPA: hypothetical protein VF980_12475 [Thermoanaerobaculia bacterium]
MRRSRPELIVPVRDRRQHRRILTLRNFRNAVIVIIVLVAGIEFEAHLRNPKQGDDFGRLYAPKIESATAVPKTPQIVTEAPIADDNAADPMLVQAAARAQLLQADSNVAPLQQTPPPAAVAQSQSPLVGHDKVGRLVVVGGPEGVTVVQQSGTRPVLGGGFGRR